MQRVILAILAVITLCGFATQNSALTNPVPAINAADESAVRAVVDAFADSWSRHDMKAMHALDTEDVEWISVVGHYWRGRDTVFKGHTAIHKGMSGKTTAEVKSVTIRSITPNVVIAVATMQFSASTDPHFKWVTAAKTRASFTMVKRDGTWKIVHFQNTEIAPKSENDDLPSFADTGFPPPPQ